MKRPYIFTHMDFMVNLSNWIGGERDDRVYYAVPFAGFGYHVSGFTDKFQRDWGYGTDHSFVFAGLLNKFRVCPALDIELELRLGAAQQQHALNPEFGNTEKVAAGTRCDIGLTYRFNRRGFKQASPYTAADVMAYQAAVADYVIWLWPQYRPTMPTRPGCGKQLVKAVACCRKESSGKENGEVGSQSYSGRPARRQCLHR